jgi:transcriptional regulator with XRE-family HTH domain
MPESLATKRLDSEAIFEQLDRRRRELHLTRKELCDRIGVTGSTFCGWGHGLGISGSALARIAEWLDIDVRDFIKRDEAAEKARGPAPQNGTWRVEPTD